MISSIWNAYGITNACDVCEASGMEVECCYVIRLDPSFHLNTKPTKAKVHSVRIGNVGLLPIWGAICTLAHGARVFNEGFPMLNRNNRKFRMWDSILVSRWRLKRAWLQCCDKGIKYVILWISTMLTLDQNSSAGKDRTKVRGSESFPFRNITWLQYSVTENNRY